jgi:hypothetical protein
MLAGPGQRVEVDNWVVSNILDAQPEVKELGGIGHRSEHGPKTGDADRLDELAERCILSARRRGGAGRDHRPTTVANKA